MDFRLSEEQEELCSMARSFLEEHSGPEQVRSAMETELGYDPDTWKLIATELCWPCIHIPEEYGGLGLSHVDLMLLLEATGESLLCAPFFSTVALGANGILELASDEQKASILPSIAEGTTTATLAFAERPGRWDAEGIQATATADGDGFVLEGEKCWVVDGHSADRIVVVARTPGSEGEEGLSAFIVAGDAAGLSRKGLPTMDQTRKLAEIRLEGVRVEADACLGEPGAAWPGLRRTLDLAAIALAAEQVGGAQRCLDMAVAYAKEREQFGRPIGSFQAIKHKCADMMIAVESARSAVYYAACIAVDESDDLTTNASLAKAWCSDAYFQVAAENIQIHGGVGFTWEYDPHLHFKRARAGESWLGNPSYHRERVAKALGL
ncbi:MAG: acyl-CoA/acyl-ACP dehydrogenase [Deltaproteobacteria bacterium]|jgi:alkylation response protein AidB-like acyl-CoA dehydrogenase|nr:acyl-CoA/acyl-ACP dehydrogenase [Deltaproteobacteria bacterium]MBW2500746.1 acyl-CoA/acyl-ACP dehydrogenase [Deltaproteobacteria bacterium]